MGRFTSQNLKLQEQKWRSRYWKYPMISWRRLRKNIWSWVNLVENIQIYRNFLVFISNQMCKRISFGLSLKWVILYTVLSLAASVDRENMVICRVLKLCAGGSVTDIVKKLLEKHRKLDEDAIAYILKVCWHIPAETNLTCFEGYLSKLIIKRMFSRKPWRVWRFFMRKMWYIAILKARIFFWRTKPISSW